MLLSKKDKTTIRHLAADAYQESGGDLYTARHLVRSDIKLFFKQKYGSIIATILISVAVRLAVALIKHWIENNVLSPSKKYEVGEPGYDPNL